MTADPSELLKGNDIAGALAALQDRVRAAPADARLRIFLFQLLCVTGDWKRAITQLRLCAELDGAAIPMAQTYREAIICELYRDKVFAGEKEPLIFGEPADWLALLVQAQGLQGQGRAAEAAGLRARAFDAAPATPGTLDGAPFAWIADADMRLGPVLEAVINGRYFWVPFAAIASVAVEPPADLRDAVWTPATLRLTNGGEVVALLPTRYPGTATEGTEAEKLSRATSWTELDGGTFAGRGQRVLSTDAAETGLMDMRLLSFDPVAAAVE